MNVSKIVHAAARQLGIVASGENLAASELQDGIECLQGLLAQWGTQRLMVHKSTDIVIPLIEGKTLYRLGKIAGDCCEYELTCDGEVLAQPDISTDISHIADTGCLNDCPIMLVRDTNTTAPCNSNAVTFSVDNPNWLFYTNGKAGTLKIKVYAMPYNLCTHDELHLPRVYERALKLSLALEMAPEYGQEPSLMLQRNQLTAMRNLTKSNVTPIYAAKSDFNIGVGAQRRGGLIGSGGNSSGVDFFNIVGDASSVDFVATVDDAVSNGD